jgi:hypothetical protein
MSRDMLDIYTLSINLLLFWVIVILLILYPKIYLKKIQKRTQNLKRS